MKSYPSTQAEIVELKQTMGFRINSKVWADYAEQHSDGCTSVELIEFVKKWMNPPYEKPADQLDTYLENILKEFINFIRPDTAVKIE